MPSRAESAYEHAREAYTSLGVDTDAALDRLDEIPISLHCWQGDDVAGFEPREGDIGGGLAVTGNYPGRARTPAELRQDLERATSLLPGNHRLNLHASYAETEGENVERTDLTAEHFAGWIDWARDHRLGLDFNPTFFAHPLAEDGWTLAAADDATREYWIAHGRACRRIGAAMGEALGSPCVTNVWIPDGYKDSTIDRAAPRERLVAALDAVFEEKLDPEHNLDAVEAKLFGIGSESYVAGSHEFYLGYAISRQKVLCLDAGHFHPTEVISDKISAVMQFVPRLLLHISRGVRWDSDHVVTLGEETRAIAAEVVRNGYLPRVHIGLDFFDASINRVAAWVIGTRAVRKALLAALLEPTAQLRAMEAEGDFTARLAWLEELKTFPLGAVWNYYCERSETPPAGNWLDAVRQYELDVLAKRGS